MSAISLRTIDGNCVLFLHCSYSVTDTTPTSDMYLYSDAGLQHEVGYFKNSMRQHLRVCVCLRETPSPYCSCLPSCKVARDERASLTCSNS